MQRSDLDFKRGVSGDVRRDGEEIPTRWALPGSELDFKRGLYENVRRNGEEIPRSDTNYLQKGQQSLPRTTSIVILEDNREAATVAPIEGRYGGHGQCDGRRRLLRVVLALVVRPGALVPAMRLNMQGTAHKKTVRSNLVFRDGRFMWPGRMPDSGDTTMPQTHDNPGRGMESSELLFQILAPKLQNLRTHGNKTRQKL